MLNGIYLLLVSFLWLVPMAQARDDDRVALTLQLRTSDGTPLVGATVILEQLPDAAAMSPDCLTHSDGTCQWFVAPGLYQVRFPAYSLDDLSALALAEGGLSGLGVNVGEEAISYHFTLQEDGHIYFDATPDAAAPAPRLPTQTDLSGGVLISEVMRQVTDPEAIATPVMLLPEPEKATLVPSWWLWLAGGVVLSFIGWLVSRYRRRALTTPTTQKA